MTLHALSVSFPIVSSETTCWGSGHTEQVMQVPGESTFPATSSSAF